MPLYCHKDTVSGKEVEINRSFADYLDEPTEEEATAAGIDYKKAKWERIIGRNIKVTFGANYGGSHKGSW